MSCTGAPKALPLSFRQVQQRGQRMASSEVEEADGRFHTFALLGGIVAFTVMHSGTGRDDEAEPGSLTHGIATAGESY